jgi:uncharacterized protein YqjF (DUF2071 family)
MADWLQPAWFIAIILGCWCSQAATALTVRETEHDVAFINIPIAQTMLQKYLNDDLQPVMYNGSAWLALVAFQLFSLETEIGHTFVPLPGVSGTIVKTVAFVMRKDGSQKGYMILDMDFSSRLQALGCSTTQPGVHCYLSRESNINGSNVVVTTEDQLTLKMAYKNSGVPADANLVSIATELHWKYEQKDVKGAWTAGNQTGHIHKPATAITLTTFQSDLVAHRHGWSGEAADSVCHAPGTCFQTPMLQFIDKE